MPSAPTPGLARRLALRLVLLAVGGAGLATVLGFMGAAGWVLDLFVHFRIQYAVILLVAGVAALPLRERGLAAWAVLLAIVNGVALAPLWLGGRPATAGARASSVKLLALNIDMPNPHTDRVAALIARLDPDILVLTEINATWMKALAPVLRRYRSRREEPRDDSFGLGVYTKVPFLSSSVRAFGGASAASIVADIELDGKKVTIIGVHPKSPTTGFRSHDRDLLLGALASERELFQSRLIVAGDFNTTPFSRTYGNFVKETHLENARSGFGYQGTWPSWFPLLEIPIDHCLVSEQFVVVKHRIEENVGSDHLPVYVELAAVE